MTARVLTVKGSNVRVGDFLITGWNTGFVVTSIIDIGSGSFGAVRDVYGEHEDRTIYGTDRVKVERTY